MDTQINQRLQIATTLMNLLSEYEDRTTSFLTSCYEQLLEVKFQLDEDSHKYEPQTKEYAIIRRHIHDMSKILHKLN